MKPWQSLKIAFSMYSKIPMPKTDWTSANLGYAFCFFPLVGVPIGALLAFWHFITSLLSIHPVLFASVACVIPLGVTGGIHLDGFCDTVDALSSRQPREKKLEILKDPHTGAFAILGCIAYFLLAFGFWTQLSPAWPEIIVLGLSFVLSRSLSGLSVVTFRPAKNSGLLKTFSDAAQKQTAAMVCAIVSAACFGIMAVFSWPLSLACLAGSGLSFLYYRIMSYRQFGGITGDIAGYFLQLCELSMLGCVIFTQIILGGTYL